MTQPATSLAVLVRLLLREGKRHAIGVAAVFAIIALAGLAIGVLKPKDYQSRAVILVESKNVITPLMEGRAVTTGVTDQAAIAISAMHSRRILREIMALAGWEEQSDPRVEERMLTKLSRRIRISRGRPELVSIAYVDSDPQRCLAVTRKLAEIYINEASFAKARQSSEAFEFIDQQVSEYAAKMASAHAAVQAYSRRSGASSTSSGARRKTAAKRPGAVAAPASEPRVSAEDLAALRAEEVVLVAQLGSGELRQAQQRRAERIAQLQRELDDLLGTYTDRHPNVARAREELQLAKEDAASAAMSEDQTARVVNARLDEVRSRIAAATAQSATAQSAAARDGTEQGSSAATFSVTQSSATGAGVVGLRVVTPPQTLQEIVMSQDSTLADLLRRYESTRDVYQDLLRRRENARVSMELDAEHRGLSVRVYEEPELPLLPTGMRLMHFVVLGLLLAGGVPIGLLLAFVRYDPRIRSAEQLERAGVAPLLVSIPFAATASDTAHERRRIAIAGALVAAVFGTYAVFFALRLGLDVQQILDTGRRLFS